MKKFRKHLALFLCALLLLPAVSVNPAFAEGQDVYPESEHYYSNNYYNEWTYTYPKEAEGLFVTFSKKTKTEAADSFSNVTFENEGEISFEDVVTQWADKKIGDYISIFDKDNSLIGVYQGNDLSGTTIYVPGNTFKITLTTDSSVTAYGFSIDRISDEAANDVIAVVYDFGNGKFETDVFNIDYLERYYCYENADGSSVLTAPLDSSWHGLIAGDGAVIGWKGEDGTVYSYDIHDIAFGFSEEERVFPVEDGKNVYRFTAVKTPVTLKKEDVYNFTNSSQYFDVDGSGGYYMTKENYLRLVASACVIHGAGPLALPAAVLSSILISYPRSIWDGSCIGFTTTVCLQKEGILDVVGTQEEAKCVNDLKPTDELISLLNYYNGQAALTTVTKNKANYKTPKEFSRQLEKMFESVCAGNLVLMEFLSLGDIENSFADSTYHGFVFTGGYTDENGNHVLFYYDDNDYEYGGYGKCSVCYIEPDFSAIHTENYGDLETIFWTDEFEAYKSLDINGKDNSVFHYWKEFIKHIFKIVRDWIEFYILGSFKK